MINYVSSASSSVGLSIATLEICGFSTTSAPTRFRYPCINRLALPLEASFNKMTGTMKAITNSGIPTVQINVVNIDEVLRA